MSLQDDAVSRLGAAAIEYGDGFANHGPMAAEALGALGREDAIPAFAEAYGRQLSPGPAPGSPLRGEWPGALGRPERMADWTAQMAQELADAPWTAVLERWAPRLAPGMVGDAAHGWLRAAHAVRALATADTPVRRLELARGLAHWAVGFTPLPGVRRQGHLRPAEATAALPLLRPTGKERLLTEGVARVAASGAFADAVEAADLRGAPLSVVADLTRAAASCFLANSHRGPLFAMIHMVTASSALRLVIPHVSDEAAGILLWHGWQAMAALFSPFAAVAEPALGKPHRGDVAGLVTRAIACGDEHGIKFTEACLREHAARPDPIFLSAADDLVGCFEALRRSP